MTTDLKFHGAVLRRMHQQLTEVMADVENNSMISSSLRTKTLGDMQIQLDALAFGAAEIERAYGVAPQIIDGAVRSVAETN